MFEAFFRDLRFAGRGLRRSAGFTAAAVVTLALGIGATTAVFSVVYSVLFRPLPFPNADRLVQVVQLLPLRPGQPEQHRGGLTPGQVTEWRATSHTLAAIGNYSSTSTSLTDVAAPVRLQGARVSVPLFRALGVAPLTGRLFVDEDELPGNNQVVILSHDTWMTRFSGATDLLEKTITLSGRPHRVIGIMPPGFGFPSMASEMMSLNSAGELSDAPEFWLPEAARPRPSGPAPARGGMTLMPTLALLRPDVTFQQATAEVNTLMPAREGHRYPVELVSARVEQARRVRPVLLLFQGAVLFVLFIACVNVVNLLRARAADRRHELVMRLALGASRRQLARYAMTEGLIISIAGGTLGTWVAFGTVALVRALPPYVLPRMAEIRVDGIVLAAAAGLSIVAGLLVGATAAARLLQRDVAQESLAVQPRASTGGGHRAARALLIAQTAAGVILLAGAGLLLTSFAKLTSVPRGFDPGDVFTFRLSLPPQRYQEVSAQYAFHDQFLENLRQLPGVTSVGASAWLLGQGSVGFGLTANGQKVSRAEVGFQTITAGVFETLRVPLTGRDFTTADRGEVARTAIVNEEFVRRYLGGGNAIGQHLEFQLWPALEIIGVVGDTRTRELDNELSPALYLPQDIKSAGLGAATYYVRTSQPSGLLQAVRDAAARQDASAVVFDATPMPSLLARSVMTPKVYGATALGFAAVAVALAALGLFGVLSYSVGTRTREFGIRIALGASSRTVLAKVMREALETVAIGVVLGTVGALYLSRFLETLLYEVEPGDPTTLAAVAALFLIVAALAAYLPARRATLVDPLVALRTE